MSMSVDSIARVTWAADCELVRVNCPGITLPAWDEVDEMIQDEWRNRVIAYLDDPQSTENYPVYGEQRTAVFAAIVDELDDRDPEEPSLRLDERHPSIAGVLRWLDVNPRLGGAQFTAATLARITALAWADLLPENAETTAALRKLLEAKDCAVRSSFDIPDDDPAAADVVDLDARRAAA